MDTEFSRPRFEAQPVGGGQINAASIGTSLVSNMATTNVAGGVTLREPIKIDFAAGAKAFKRSRLKKSMVRGFVVSCVISAAVLLSLAAVGVWVNHHFAGRALPYTYVGTMRVGGMSEAQIKTALDARANETIITLQDGGLQHTLRPGQIGASFDTSTASKQAMHGNLQLFSYLSRKRVDVSVTVQDRLVAGYVADRVHRLQTKAKDAYITQDRGKLVIQPELVGFESDPKFITRSIVTALSSMENPVVNVNAVTVRPRVFAADLQDDLERANSMVKAKTGVQYSGVMFRPTEKQKVAWMQTSVSEFDKSVELKFDRLAVRQYVNDIARRYIAEGSAVFDIDEVTTQLVTALNSGASATVQTASAP